MYLFPFFRKTIKILYIGTVKKQSSYMYCPFLKPTFPKPLPLATNDFPPMILFNIFSFNLNSII